MADLLAHPDKDRDFSTSVFDLADGQVVLRSATGERLTLATGVLLLDLAKQMLLAEALGAEC